jgi:hypothetical protein
MKAKFLNPFLLLRLALILAPNYLISQSSTELSFSFEKTHFIKEKYPEKDVLSDFQKIKIILKRDSIPAFDFRFSVKIKHVTTSPEDVKLLTENFVITKEDFHREGSSITKEIILEIRRDTVDKSDEVFELIIVPDEKSLLVPFKIKEPEKLTITIVNSVKPSDPENPFRITTGANFDFDKTLKASLYFDAQVFKPILLSPCKKDNRGFGVYSSLYNNRFISSDSVQDTKTFYDIIGNGDTVDMIRYNYQIGASNSVKNIGSEIALLYSFQNKMNNDLNLSFSFLLELGAISRNITTTYSYNKINQDTIFNIPNPNNYIRLVEREFVNTRINDVMFGSGFIFRMKSKSHGEFMLKATSGCNNTYFPEEMLKRIYYDFRFQILDPKVGINLGGQIRGYYKQGSPYFSVYLSKSFSLSKLTELSVFLLVFTASAFLPSSLKLAATLAEPAEAGLACIVHLAVAPEFRNSAVL